jgi:anti-sigma regulatory factor (Ser/Thr protein kinase)
MTLPRKGDIMTTTLPQVRTFPADGSALAQLREFVRGRAEEAAVPGDATEDLLVAVTEACTEMLSHERGSSLVVSWWAREGAVEIRVKDEGVVRLEPEALESDDEGEFGAGGLGFPHILAFVDEYVVRPGTPEHPSTTIRLVKETTAA